MFCFFHAYDEIVASRIILSRAGVLVFWLNWNGGDGGGERVEMCDSSFQASSHLYAKYVLHNVSVLCT